ncbi:TadC protein [Pseudarthrobacter sp. Y6]|uniref:TadC protein n=1 Tax=Pseudarthrobacter sp. Y6 TaxID=3418422 RepID=UPI00336718B1
MIWTTLIIGGTVGLALVWIVAELSPRHPKLSAALENLGTVEVDTSKADFRAQLGRLMQRGVLSKFGVNKKDLALVGATSEQHSANQALMGIMGLVIPPAFGTVFVLILGLPAPILIFSLPVSLGLAVLLMWATNLTITQKAAEARQEFARAVATYIELVAAERKRATAATIALEHAADVADSWVFVRIRQELQLARYKGQRPWDALKQFSKEIGVPELSDLADIMRLAGAEGASVYEPLRARGKGLRVQLLNEARSRANADSERITMPMALMGLIFIALIATPPLFKLITS